MNWLFRVLEWWKAYQLEKLEIKQAMAVAPYKAIEQMVDKLTRAMESNSAVLKAWMDSFTTTAVPASTIMRDEDEVRDELERLGFERPELHESINAALKAGAFPDLKAIIAEVDG